MGFTARRFGRNATLLAGIRAGGNNLCRLPKRLFKALSGLSDRSGAQGLVRLTVAGAAQVGCYRASGATFLLPVELRCVNHAASTNGFILNAHGFQVPYNRQQMPDSKPIDQIAERVERLLLRHEELQRTNTLLQSQVHDLQVERDLLKSRLQAARARIDVLLERLPTLTDGTPPKDIE
jgi:hypothetical protein